MEISDEPYQVMLEMVIISARSNANSREAAKPSGPQLGCGSFSGKKMVCSARWFPDVQFLGSNLLNALEEWIVDEGAMPFLECLVICLCIRLKMLPRGLQHLEDLEELGVVGMPQTFKGMLQHTVVQDWGKIQRIKSVTVDEIRIATSASASDSSGKILK